MINELINKISEVLKSKQLPINLSHSEMLPFDRVSYNIKEKYDGSLKSSVLVLVYPLGKDNFGIVLIKKQDYDGIHSGQIAFPGGKIEDKDKSLENAAIRETFEEIGVKILKKNIIGRLSSIYIPPSNFILTPVIGYLENKPQFKINNYEVKEIIEISINDLLDKNNLSKDLFETSYGKIEAPCFCFKSNKVWGATAMILNEFKTILKVILS